MDGGCHTGLNITQVNPISDGHPWANMHGEDGGDDGWDVGRDEQSRLLSGA